MVSTRVHFLTCSRVFIFEKYFPWSISITTESVLFLITKKHLNASFQRRNGRPQTECTINTTAPTSCHKVSYLVNFAHQKVQTDSTQFTKVPPCERSSPPKFTRNAFFRACNRVRHIYAVRSPRHLCIPACLPLASHPFDRQRQAHSHSIRHHSEFPSPPRSSHHPPTACPPFHSSRSSHSHTPPIVE